MFRLPLVQAAMVAAVFDQLPTEAHLRKVLLGCCCTDEALMRAPQACLRLGEPGVCLVSHQQNRCSNNWSQVMRLSMQVKSSNRLACPYGHQGSNCHRIAYYQKSPHFEVQHAMAYLPADQRLNNIYSNYT